VTPFLTIVSEQLKQQYRKIGSIRRLGLVTKQFHRELACLMSHFVIKIVLFNYHYGISVSDSLLFDKTARQENTDFLKCVSAVINDNTNI